jgi:hypothetical protein
MVQDCGLNFQDRIYVLDIRSWLHKKINGYEPNMDKFMLKNFRTYYIIMREPENR